MKALAVLGNSLDIIWARKYHVQMHKCLTKALQTCLVESSVLKRALEFPSNVCAIKPDVIIPEKEDWLWMLLLWQPISLYSLSTYPVRQKILRIPIFL